MKTWFMVLTTIILAAVVALLVWSSTRRGTSTIRSFEECAAAGYPVAQSYPRQCSVPGDRNFVEQL